MLPFEHVIELSRWQFAITALMHFLFVPLTLGLAWILFGMECLYYKTGNIVYKDMVRFWGKLFGINFAMGVVTGIVMEFELGVNWGYYSHYVGNIFGTSLAIEGTLAFMLESAVFGIFFFGWDKLSKGGHLFVTFCLALGSCLSAVMILVSNGWMQHPVSYGFNVNTMSADMKNFASIFFNETSQSMFAHTLTAGLTTASMFVAGISAFYLLRKRDMAFAKRSFVFSSVFGIISLIGVGFYGDHVGLDVNKVQKMKMAAIEAVWDTPKPPAAWHLIAFPSNTTMSNRFFVIDIPYALSLIADHSLSGTVEGMHSIVDHVTQRITNGRLAYLALVQLRENKADQNKLTPRQYHLAQTQFNQFKQDLGYGLLLKAYVGDNLQHVTPEQISEVAHKAIPQVWIIFYAFRLMVLAFGLMLLATLLAIFFYLRNTLWEKRWLLRTFTYLIPVPFLASSFGWIVAEHGRQPWVVEGVLPTGIGVSSLHAGQVWFSLIGFCLFYLVLFSIEVFLMFKFGRRGPSALHTGRYHFEQETN